MRRKLPLDPFDPATSLDLDYQSAGLVGAITLAGFVGGGYLIVSANYDEWAGWLISLGGAAVIAVVALIARKFIKSI